MLADLRLSLRALRKSPGFAFVAVATLTLGIGVNTAMFGIVNALLLRGLPFPAQDRLLYVGGRQLKFGGRMGLSHLDLADYRAAQKSFEELAAYRVRSVNLSSTGTDPLWAVETQMSARGATLLRVPVVRGRWFQPEDEADGAPRVVVIGYALWQNRHGGNDAAVGQAIKVNGQLATIVGVAPKDFRFPQISDLWEPLSPLLNDPRDARYLDVFGRLRDGVAPEAAQAEFAAIAQRLATAHAETNENVGVQLERLHHQFLDEDTRKLVVIMFGAVGLVLLIACANLANLLLARAAVREKEIAIRTALGASRTQLMRLLLVETLVLSLAGAAGGLPLAYALLAALNAHLRSQVIPYWMVFDVDGAGIGYVVALAGITCLAAGLWPAWRMSRADVNAALKDGGRGSTGFSLSRFTRAMVIGEVILSTVLLVLSALTIRSVVNAQRSALGFRTTGIFTSRVTFSGTAYEKPQPRLDFMRELQRRLAARPEVEAVAFATRLPTQASRERVTIEDQPRDAKDLGLASQFASEAAVSGSYFNALDVRLVDGRTFDDRDRRSTLPVAIVSTAFADAHWPHTNPIGKRFAYGEGGQVKPDDWRTVVGVVAATQGPFSREMINVPQTYVPFAQEGSDTRYTVVFTRARGEHDPALLSDVVRQEVRAIDADQPVHSPRTLADAVAQAWFYKQLLAFIFGVFGVVALGLAAIGLYGVMSYSVSQRTQEIGVRMALGAEPGDVLAMILREGGLRLALGLAIGVVVAFFAGRLLAFTLYGVEPSDAWSFGGTTLVLGITGFLACLVPALRAVRVNPVEALRQD